MIVGSGESLNLGIWFQPILFRFFTIIIYYSYLFVPLVQIMLHLPLIPIKSNGFITIGGASLTTKCGKEQEELVHSGLCDSSKHITHHVHKLSQ